MSVPPIIRDNFLSAICTATLVVPTTFFLTKTLIFEPKIEQLQLKNKDISNNLEKLSNDINGIDRLKGSLNQCNIEKSSLISNIKALELQKIDLNKDIVKTTKENEGLKAKDTEFKTNNFNYIKSEIEILKQEKHRIRNPTSIQVIYGGKSNSKELSLDDKALEKQIQNQIDNLQNKLLCSN
jgi:chromosome segregation ATPase